MNPHPIFRLFFLLALLPSFCFAQNSVPKQSAASPQVSFRMTGNADSNRAIMYVVIKEALTEEPILGATVLLRRDIDKMYGKVTGEDGDCIFVVAPGNYAFRVQMTGLISLEQEDFELEAGKTYELKLTMVSNTR